MKKSMLLAALAALVTITTAPAFAGTPRLDAREFNQRARIHNGVANGELTRLETRRLAAGQVHLNRAEARVKSDGVVTGRERAYLNHEANQQSRRIYRQKHDAQDRG
jgi:outer membrane lipopolysaccharide assembly protein LptE/RlpB